MAIKYFGALHFLFGMKEEANGLDDRKNVIMDGLCYTSLY